MQTAQEFLLWYLDKSRTEIDFAEVDKNILSLPEAEKERVRKAIKFKGQSKPHIKWWELS